MKIIAFAQLRNELSAGNLEIWFKSVAFCDYVYIYDQASDDGSREYYKKFPNTVVIESPINNFLNEILCKKELLEKLLSDHPDVDWIYWSDGDMVMDGRICKNPERLKDICRAYKDAESISFGYLNIFRSDSFYRMDGEWGNNNRDGLVCLWRNTGQLRFNAVPGLHKPQFPDPIRTTVRCHFYILHTGFATDKGITHKIELYLGSPDSSWDGGAMVKYGAIKNFVDEDQLLIGKVPTAVLPSWHQFTENDVCPLVKDPFVVTHPQYRYLKEHNNDNRFV